MGNLKDRRNQILIIFSLIFLIISLRLIDITVIKGEYYREVSLNNRVRKIPVVAKRGEIYDRNGKLIAGNIPAFTIELSGSILTSKELNEVSIKLLNILDEKGEERIEFPIVKRGNEYYFTYDKNIEKYLLDNGYDKFATASKVFQEIRTREQISDELSNKDAKKFLLMKGVSLPLSVSKMKFWSQIEKERFLKSYNLDLDISAEDALKKIRNLRYYRIDKEYSDEDALKILAVKHSLRTMGYLKYTPIKIAKSVSKDTAVLLEEMSMELKGVNVTMEPKRYYPYSDSAAHIIGYMGKISSEFEIDKYVKQNGYDKSQLIGKVGIEGKYELDLKGENGYKYIEVDALGKLVKTADESLDGIDSKSARAGKDITLTIDMDLQRKLEKHVKDLLSALREGGTYKSEWGDFKFKEAFPKAKTAAAVVTNVNTGEVLALVSYPSYDLNLFATGISYENWKSLSTGNVKDPLAERPLYNIATLTAVQPGSTYKMITGYAALEQGLNPSEKINADGYIEIGNHRYGCWIWNDYHAKHGPIDLYKAIEESCNYYFFDISMGYDYKNKKSLDFKMSTEILLNYSKEFGLDEKTGIEIGEINVGIPSEEKKQNTTLNMLRRKLKFILPEYFPENIISSEEKSTEVIEKIVALSDLSISRGQLIKKLVEFGAVDDYYQVEKLADIIKYDYFRNLNFSEGDGLNLAIGQGDHKYTPVQMVRYISTIANGGKLNELTLIKKIGDVSVIKNKNVTNENFSKNSNLEEIKKGMLEVTIGKRGTAKTTFKDFPVKVAAKTGTAEKSGTIPPKSEKDYIKKYLKYINPNLTYEEVEKRSLEIVKERNDELAKLQLKKIELEKKLEENTISESEKLEIEKLENKIEYLFRIGYVSEDRTIREALKELTEFKLTDTMINKYRDEYDSFAWFVSFAPYDNPEIAVVVLVPQGGHGGYAAPIARDIIADYLKLNPQNDESVNE